MQAHVDQLELVLGHQVAALTALKNWLPRKADLIRRNQAMELEAFTQREEEQVARIQQAESQRQAVMTMLALELGFTPDATLSTLLPHLPAEIAERLAARADQLQSLILQVREGQQLVAELLRVSLDYVHYNMDIFAQLATAAPPTGYGEDGDAGAPPVSSWLLDRQA